MKVVENFVSINGEGAKAGQLAMFIRFAGCNLDCSYCDTKWANEKDVLFKEMNKEEIYKDIKDSGVKNITLTGGEPLIQEGIKELLEYLSLDESISIEIETNGSVSIEPYKTGKNPPSFTMDYKLGFSNMENEMNLTNLNILDKNDVIKFVVAGKNELNRVKEILDEYSLINKTKVYVSPVFGEIENVEIVDWMKENKLNNINMQLQLHKIIWSPEKKGV